VRHHPSSTAPGFPLVAIGASTGGPKALVRILGSFPSDFRAAVTIVQHIDEQFAPGLASWLSGETGREVRIIQPNDRLTMGVQLASSNDHLVLTTSLAFDYISDPIDNPYRPSIDVFFRSVAKEWPGTAVGVLLTGMGADGAEGLLVMRRLGWHTIAQDEATSVVYGMPKAASQLGAAVDVLPVDQIGPAIARSAGSVSNISHRSPR
jgi:chemotaxis response regulator CheB